VEVFELSVSSISRPLMRVFRELNMEHLVEQLDSFVVEQRLVVCHENKCLTSRYNGNACVRCLGNYSSIPAFRHFVTILYYIMALQPIVAPWPLFQFLDPLHSRCGGRSVGIVRLRTKTTEFVFFLFFFCFLFIHSR
jgi:hypothetical protein